MRPNVTCSCSMLALAVAMFGVQSVWQLNSASGQQMIRHELIRGDMPPGVAAGFYKLANRDLVGHVQPVQLIGPQGCTFEVGVGGTYTNAFETQATMGMQIGPVYRFRVSNLPVIGQQGKALYPSIEVINRLYPPKGLKQEFPIQVVLTEDDIMQAVRGKMVTKVVYLEDPRGTLPYKHAPGQQPSVDVSGGTDPLRAAEQMGRPMAILRMGSRIPMANDPTETFNFGSPAPQFLSQANRAATIDPVSQASQNAKRLRQQPSLNQKSMDPVAMAARAQYEAAIKETKQESKIVQASATSERKLAHPLPAPIIESDIDVANDAPQN